MPPLTLRCFLHCMMAADDAATMADMLIRFTACLRAEERADSCTAAGLRQHTPLLRRRQHALSSVRHATWLMLSCLSPAASMADAFFAACHASCRIEGFQMFSSVIFRRSSFLRRFATPLFAVYMFSSIFSSTSLLSRRCYAIVPHADDCRFMPISSFSP